LIYMVVRFMNDYVKIILKILVSVSKTWIDWVLMIYLKIIINVFS
jgi:hypothetical protein